MATLHLNTLFNYQEMSILDSQSMGIIRNSMCSINSKAVGCSISCCAADVLQTGVSVLTVLVRRRRRGALTPSLLCPVLASISCRARTDKDCSSTKLQMHRSGGTCCETERGRSEHRPALNWIVSVHKRGGGCFSVTGSADVSLQVWRVEGKKLDSWQGHSYSCNGCRRPYL